MAGEMENIFSGIPTQVDEVKAVEEVATVEEVKAPKTKDAKIEVMKEALKATLETDATYKEKLKSLSDTIEVTNTLGYGTSGNIVKVAGKGGTRELVPTSAIVGYRLINKGPEPIKYTTEIYTKNEEGIYVGEVVERTANPGETFDLTRQYMTIFAAPPSISFTLGNGKIISGSRKKVNSLKEELESYYFTFNREEDGTLKQVNDDEVKLAVDHDVDGERVVKPEFAETFGFLDNPKPSRKKRAAKKKYTTQDLAANYIHTLLKKEAGEQ